MYNYLILAGFALLLTGCFQKQIDYSQPLNGLSESVQQLNESAGQLNDRVANIVESMPNELDRINGSNGTSVYIEEEGDRQRIILKMWAEETTIEEVTTNIDKNGCCKLGSPEFSPDEKYVLYTKHLWEGAQTQIYSLERDELVLTLTTPESFGFISDTTQGQSLLYVCATNELGGIFYGRVYSVPEFTTLFDTDSYDFEGYYSVTCRYVEGEPPFIRFTMTQFKMTQFDQKNVEFFDYLISTGEILRNNEPT